MIYKQYKDISLSMLGLGCMRLPVIDGDNAKIDQERVNGMVDYALENGINYFDTAYGYHNGMSEIAIGKALARHPRESFYLASKFPGYDLNNMDKVEAIFEEQLKKCGVDYFDFYLFHNVCEKNIDAYLDPKYGIFDYLMKQKKNGRIRHLGFSGHGDMETLTRFLDAYGADMEFGQLQINWLDWTFQDAKGKVALFDKYRIPVWVMEPVRGGRLAVLSPDDEERLRALRPDETVPGWAFRFIQSLPSVTMTLSGMSNEEQLRANIETYKEAKPLNDKEWEVFSALAQEMIDRKALPCTGCRYCTTHCPMELDIPKIISIYNEHIASGGGFIPPKALADLQDKLPTACLGCGACESVCPQNIEIRKMMRDFAHRMGD